MRDNMNLLLGVSGEFYALRQFEALGYKVEYAQTKKQGDLKVVDMTTGQIVKVEIKTARKGRNLNYQVCLKKKGKTDVAHSDLVVIQLVLGTGEVVPFFIPAPLLADKQGISFTRAQTYNGKWAQYRQDSYAIFGGVV